MVCEHSSRIVVPFMVAETQDLVVFSCVAKHACYARAAEELSLSASGVSRIVTRLEERLGVRLVHRTTRKLSLTEVGAAFHARATQILADLADAEAEVQKTATQPKGTLKLTAPLMFGQLYLAPILGELLHQFPQLSVDLSLTNRFVDLIDEGMDLALRIGQLADSQLVARRLCTNHRILVAAPGYLERWGTPSRPEDLTRHQCVLFNGFPKASEWKLVGPSGPVNVSVVGRIATNNVETLTSVAKQGLGITVGATMSVGPALLSGDLVRVLSDYEFEPTAVFAVYTSARQLSTKVRATVDFLAKRLSDPPVWDQSLRGKVAGFPMR
jgi:DNA-binding transcriptional LysR family regulator